MTSCFRMGPQRTRKETPESPRCSPGLDPAPVRLGDCWGTANTESVFKKDGEEVQLAGP